MSDSFIPAIAACLQYPGGRSREELENLVRHVLDGPPAPSHADLAVLQQRISDLLPGDRDRIALVYGGATKIKGYVFEAPKLPEIRGASALLDRINTVDLRELWTQHQLSTECIIYASGGNILAFAPASEGTQLAAEIEQTYARETGMANSVAVSAPFRLIELRYGLQPDVFWREQFDTVWRNDELQPLLASYYYGEKEDAPETRFLRRKKFGELVTHLATLANRRRESLTGDDHNPLRRDIAHDQLLPGQVRCVTSGIRPAVVQTYQPDRPLISEASARKLYVGQKIKRPNISLPWFEQTFPPLETPDSWEARFTHARVDNDTLPEARIEWAKEFPKTPYAQAMQQLSAKGGRVVSARDVGEIGQASLPDSYIGMIYADGNNIGRRVASLQTPQAYWAFSRKLEEATFRAVFTALATHLRPALVTSEEGERRWTHPFEIITIGGDDLLLIVPGSAALDIALTIGAEFERAFPSPTPERMAKVQSRYQVAPGGGYEFANHKPDIGLSAGVVIAPENTPIFFLRELAEELLKSAKRKAKLSASQRCTEKQAGLISNGSGALDFMVMKSITMVTDNIAAFREQAFGTGQDSAMRLTGRPFTWPELHGLLATARTLRDVNFPRSQLYRLRSQLVDARERSAWVASVMDYLYIRVRLKPEDGDILKTAFDAAWHGDERHTSQPPWLVRSHDVRLQMPEHTEECDLFGVEQSRETIWPDLVEIYDFIQAHVIASAEHELDIAGA